MTAVVDVQYATIVSDLPSETVIGQWIDAALRGDDAVEVSVRIVDATESAQLNRRYRNKPGPTNVLAFPAEIPDAAGPNLLGDLVICAPLVVAQARDQGKTPVAHWAHLFVHGTLHLQGFDHEKEADAMRMEALEVDILARLGYSNPYQADESAADQRGADSPQ